MRTSVLALLAVAAALGISACGSSSASDDVVPKTVPNLSLPAGTAALAPASSSGSADQTSTSSSSQSQSQSQSSSGTPGTGTTGSTGTGTGTTGNGTSGNTGGTSPGEFSKFCQDNPGACPGN